MGGKKKGKEKKKSDEPVLGEDPKVLLANYMKFSKAIGLEPHPQIKAQLEDEEKDTIEQLVVSGQPGGGPAAPLGPGGTRALATAILGTSELMAGGPYKLLKALRIWNANVGDDGTQSLAELLRLGGGDVTLAYLELFDNNIGPRGCQALGRALTFGDNISLLTLKLDYNISIGAEGVAALCRGLRTNKHLKQLHLAYCAITPEAGAPLGDMLSYSGLALAILNLQGNRLGGAGLGGLCPGLARNRGLQYLGLADNGIGELEGDDAHLRAFGASMLSCETLTHVDLLYNRIGEMGAAALQPFLLPENTRIKQFLVDANLPEVLFGTIFRRDTSGGKKKKGKKGGKKKKK
mmetsp:Transcript_665/g.1109  ORF Transcript_665/g.1109 Transcript_665/m.1109 type:complete len:349 (-) Transcript_665:103-1149(-)